MALLSHCIQLQWHEDEGQAGVPELAGELVETVVLMARMKGLVKLVDHGVSLFVEAEKGQQEERPALSTGPSVCEVRIE